MLETKVYFDGACGYKLGGNLVGIGVVAKLGTITYEHAESYPYLGNNIVAEWVACIRALEMCILIEKRHGRCVFIILGDNQAVIRHMQRIYKDVKKEYKELVNQAEALAKQIRYLRFKWIPRKLNTEADLLSKIGRLMWFDNN